MNGQIASIQARLKNVYKQSQSSHQLILTRYFQERLLFRLAQSKFRNNFLLKGGVLIYALSGINSRPTIDLDLLARKTTPDPESIKIVFEKIFNVDYKQDGITFDTKSIELSEIIKEGNYTGTRIKVWGYLGNIRQKMQIDIGFGDKVFPGPKPMHFPTLLAMESPEILVYSTESLIAEKFEAMISLAEYNSRMKDFYDIYQILYNETYSKDNLPKAIKATFRHRNTPITKEHTIFSATFREDRNRNKQWQQFLSRSNLSPQLPFPTVMALIQQQLEPIYRTLLV